MTNSAIIPGSTFGALIGDAAADYALITQGVRSIANLYPHVVVEEVHHDELQITVHPVEYGTPVTDHAFMQPFTVEIHCGWSDSTAATSGYVQAVYAAMLALQSSRNPFNISTGKRQYSSMLMKSVMVHTDPDSEYALMMVALAQQIVITNTSTSTASSEVTDGASQIGSVTGEPTAQIGNGVGTIPAASVSADGFGAVTWPNDVTNTGGQTLTSTAYSP